MSLFNIRQLTNRFVLICATITCVGSVSRAGQIERFFSPVYGHYSAPGNPGAAWSYDGFLGTSYDPYAPGLILLRQCYIPGRSMGLYFDSTDAGCEGQLPTGGSLGYIAPAWSPGIYGMNRPLIRCFSPSNGEHMTTNSREECVNANYVVEGVIGYTW